MEKIKRMLMCYVPVTRCNLRCKYCYIIQKNQFDDQLPNFKYSALQIGNALSQKRLGGPCYINVCGGGETLLPPEIIEITREMLKQGHYVEIVTNGTLKKRFEEIALFSKDLLNRLMFKFSFHYEELLRIGKLEEFFENVKMMQNFGCSFTIELTTFDDLISRIDEIQNICQKYLGVNCQLTVGRDDRLEDTPILSKYSIDELKEVWGAFKSEMYDFKLSTFYKKREEFCYSGDWSLHFNLGDGTARQCYKSFFTQNIFEDISSPIKFRAIGYACREPHCYNSHAMLTFGLIPELNTPTYADIRNRKCSDGTQWLQPEMKHFFSSKLVESNKEYSKLKKILNYFSSLRKKIKKRK